MVLFRRLIAGFRGVFHKTQLEQELDAELREFLETAVEEKMRTGMSRERAVRAARLELGSVAAVKDDVRDVGWETIVESCWQDVRYAIRTLLRSPGFAAVTIVTLALGIGANTAIFSVARAILFQALPYTESDRLVAITASQKEKPGALEAISYPTFLDWQAQSRSFESLAGYVVAGSTLTGHGEADVPATAAVTPNLFSLLGVAPLLGRTLVAEDASAGAPRAVVISEHLWRDRLGRTPEIVGQSLMLDGAPYIVVGVMPSGFMFPHVKPTPLLWVPLTQFQPFQTLLSVRLAPLLSVIGRLSSRSDRRGAQAEMEAISGRLAQQYPADSRGQIVEVRDLHESVVGETKSSLLMLLGAVGFLLLIACTNVASLQLARTVGRAREMMIRAALGAGRHRLFRQVLVESVLLALAGGALGLIVAEGSLRGLSIPIARELPQIRDVDIDRSVLGFTLALSCATGILFGLVPVLGSSWIDLNNRLNDGGRGTTADRRHARTQNVLVVLEVALALVMLTSAGLLTRSLVHLQQINPGFNAQRLLIATINLPQTEYATAGQWRAFNAELLGRVQRLPGVATAALGVGVPFSAPPVAVPFVIEGRRPVPSGERTAVDMVEASPDYFKVLQVPLVGGRAFADSDTQQARRVGIVNQAFARRFFGEEENPIGRSLVLGQAPQAVRLEIVGIVGDTAQTSLAAAPPALLYLPYAQRPFWITSFVLRTTIDPEHVANLFRREVAAMASAVPVLGVESMDALLKGSFAPSSYRTLLLGLLSSLALILAAVGIHGLLAYTVVKRTHEIGVRMALGAEPSRVLRIVLAQGFRLTLAGIVLGFVMSVAVTRLLGTLLFRVSTTDPLTLVGVALLLMLVTLVACYVPARRATRVDPLVALRCD